MSDDRVKRKYTCSYCQNKFTQVVGTRSGQGGGKKSKVSAQVKCTKCNNFLKTWSKEE